MAPYFFAESSFLAVDFDSDFSPPLDWLSELDCLSDLELSPELEAPSELSEPLLLGGVEP